MSNTIKPITQPEMTQTKIEYSVKIGRQVLKEKLKIEIANIRQAIKDNTQNLSVEKEEYKKLYAEMKQRVILYINNDETFHSIKLLYNILHDDEPITDILDLILDDMNNIDTIQNAIAPKNHFNYDTYKKRMDSQRLPIHIEFKIGQYEGEYEEYNHTGYCFFIDITSSLLSLMSKHEKTLSIDAKYEKDLSALTDKLHNLDETMEAMEAKLLVQELTKTDEGKEVLAITETIINDTLNSQIALT